MIDRALAQPVLDTERLQLRPFQPSDSDDVERLAGEHAIADTTLHIPHPYPPGAAVGWIAMHEPAWTAGDGASYAIIVRATGALVGAIGISIDREHESAELGYWIGIPYWNRGYGTEASRAVLTLAFGLGVHRVQARHLVRNPASGRIMQKLGMTYEGTLRGATRKWDVHEDLSVYAILAHEWREAGSESAR